MMIWQIRDRILKIDQQPLIMGIVNVTPDSFSDGGRFATTEAAVDQGLALVAQGADILDIGGESTRPGAQPVPEEEEIRRVVPVIEALAGKIDVPFSVDTSKAEVARQSLLVGAHIINDVTGLVGDPNMVTVARENNAGVVIMHMQGTPPTMQVNPQYGDVIADLRKFFQDRLEAVTSAGIEADRIVLDPGIGFGKTGRHNLKILANLATFQSLGRPILLGVSRKAFIGKILERTPDQRLAGSLAAVLFAQAHNAVQIIRTHDVRETRDAVTIMAAIQNDLQAGPR